MSTRARNRLWLGAVAAGYLALALATTWPLATQLDDALPLGCNRSATVPLVSAWALWWTADRAQHGFAGYWDAPIFYPATGTFAFSEAMPLLGLFATPILAVGGSPALAHNLVLLIALWLNGLSGYALARELGLIRPAALFGGALTLLLPYTHHQLGVLTLVPLFAMQLALLCLLRLARGPSLGRGAAAGIALAAAFAICLQHTFMLVLGLALATPWLLGRRRWSVPLLRALAAAGAVALALSAPLIVAHARALHEYRFERTVERGERGSAGIGTWLRTPYRDAVPAPGIHAASPPDKRSLFPGTLRVALALAGIGLSKSRARQRRTRFLIALIVAGVVVSVIGHVHIAGVSVYELARSAVPGLAAIRSVWRAGVVAQIGVMLLAAQGLHLTFAALRMRRRIGAAFRYGTLVLGALAAFELWPPSQRLAPVPQRDEYRAIAAALIGEAAREPLLFLPMHKDRSEEAFQRTAELMYATAFLERPWINGYSSYLPRRYKGLSGLLAEQGNAPKLHTLRATGASWIVLARRDAPALALPDTYVRIANSSGALELELWHDAHASDNLSH